MKQIKMSLTMVVLAAVVLVSCSTSRAVSDSSKSLKGTWTLNSVKVENITGTINANILNEASKHCFEGSVWNFVSSNNTGSYTINSKMGCTAVTRNIRWSIVKPADSEQLVFQYKRLDENRNEIDANKAGFRFTVVDMSATTLILKNNFVFENKNASFIYSFTKN